MRVLEYKMRNAVNNKKRASIGNTFVNVEGSDVFVYLHGNLIYKEVGGVKSFTLAGWNTVTTRSRLNALGCDVTQRNWMPYHNGELISSCGWYEV